MKNVLHFIILIPAFAFSQDQTINGNLIVTGSAQSTEFWMKSGDNQTHFAIARPATSSEPFKIMLGYQNISGGIMLGREDWTSKLLIPWKVGIGNTTPQKNLDVNTGANNYASIGQTIDV